MARMLITRANPLAAADREFMSLRQLMDQLIENSFVSPNGLPARANFDTPAMDVTESADGFTVKASLPGWKPEDVNVTFENGSLTLSGEWKDEKKTDDESTRTHVREIRQASFVRTFQFPVDVEADKAQAQFENGVLMLKLPKADVVKPKQIKIAVK